MVEETSIFVTLKKDIFGLFWNRKDRGDDYETGLKEGGVIGNVNYSASIHYNE